MRYPDQLYKRAASPFSYSADLDEIQEPKKARAKKQLKKTKDEANHDKNVIIDAVKELSFENEFLRDFGCLERNEEISASLDPVDIPIGYPSEAKKKPRGQRRKAKNREFWDDGNDDMFDLKFDSVNESPVEEVVSKQRNRIRKSQKSLDKNLKSQERDDPVARDINAISAKIESLKPLVNNLVTTGKQFEDFKDTLCPVLLETLISDMSYKNMTPIQELTLLPISQDFDSLIQANTGTGKTLAFLAPLINKIISRQQCQGIDILVIAPTRELALQIAIEAKRLAQRTDIKVCNAIGGTNIKNEQDKIKSGCQILVATPGRLLDHLQSDMIAAAVYELKTLVLDESDRLLEMGFSQDIFKILEFLPKSRQTILCSATVTQRVKDLASKVLKPDYQVYSTVIEGENTHQDVDQYFVKAEFKAHLAATISILRLPENQGCKIIVFLPTAHLANLYFIVYSQTWPESVFVQHARQTQAKRIKSFEDFRSCESGIMFATDVVARGMDFPNVHLVVQVGIPDGRETYIHRVGRSGRIGNKGRAYIILAPEEMFFFYKLKGIPISEKTVNLDHQQAQINGIQEYKRQMDGNCTLVYQSWISYYLVHQRNMKMTPEQLVDEANIFAGAVLDCEDAPPIERKTVNKMGLKGVKGLNIVRNKSLE